jgi:hypothetical protein
MKKFLFGMGIAFSIALAVIVGFRMSPDALAVIIGIVSGILASIPTSVVLVWVLRQRDKQIEAHLGQVSPGHYPPVVVVNGQGTNGYVPPVLSAKTISPGTREFKVIGQENTETIGDVMPPFWEELGPNNDAD